MKHLLKGERVQQNDSLADGCRYYAEFNGVIEGALAASWPADCETTPRGSLAKWLLMPLLPDGNLQAWLRLHPVAEPAELAVGETVILMTPPFYPY